MVISAAILAGGRASRVHGLVKGTLTLNRQGTIIERLIHHCRQAHMDRVIIVANDPEPYASFGVPVVPDKRPGAGPMAGIEAGLTHYQGSAQAVLFVPCDLPFISSQEFDTLRHRFLAGPAKAVFAMTSGSVWHPLCAIAHCDLLTTVSDALMRGERKIRGVWRAVDAEPVAFAQENAFFNVNTHADIAEMQTRLGSA